MMQSGWKSSCFAMLAFATCVAMPGTLHGSEPSTAPLGSGNQTGHVEIARAGAHGAEVRLNFAQATPPAVPQPGPQGGQQEPFDMEQFLPGVWHGEVRMGPVTVEHTLRLNRDKSFRTIQISRPPNISVEVWGTWTASTISETRGNLSSEPENWQPREFCIAAGLCQPYYFTPQAYSIERIDQDTITLFGSRFRRVQRL
jgi:hypothetical protein